jgi:hypothetical protein
MKERTSEFRIGIQKAILRVRYLHLRTTLSKLSRLSLTLLRNDFSWVDCELKRRSWIRGSRVRVRRRSGKSAHQESDNNLRRFLSRTVVTCKLAWFVSCTSFMPPFLTSVTLWCILIFLSTYWTHDVRHRDNSFVNLLSSYSGPFTFSFLLHIFSSLPSKFLL